MVISKENQEFLEGLIDYYVKEAKSYREIAQEFSSEINSVTDTAFGIIIGCIYSSFLQAYSNQKQVPDMEDIQEFNEMITKNTEIIKKSIMNENV
jgi:flagellin-specific chaperone FliS|tara:strand:- start:516 stop:800 length:285 start_codon:yes stop_codon:yes gene_type:complete